MKYKFGSNVFLAEIAMSMKEEENNRVYIGVVDGDVNDPGNTIK